MEGAAGSAGGSQAEPPWFTLAETLGARVAPLVGAEGDEVVVTGSTTGNLHQLLATFYRPAGTRTKILADALNFPSDLYAIASQVRLAGLDPMDQVKIVGSEDGVTLDEGVIIAAMTADVAVAVLPAVVYRSGQLLDMARITRVAREREIVIGWDCSHSVGAVPHRLGEWGADFAFWCSYKYLNGGPGGGRGAVRGRAAFRGVIPGLAGWFGMRKDRQFDIGADVRAGRGGGRASRSGRRTILSMAPLLGALEVIEEAGIAAIRAKSLALTRFLRDLPPRPSWWSSASAASRRSRTTGGAATSL